MPAFSAAHLPRVGQAADPAAPLNPAAFSASNHLFPSAPAFFHFFFPTP
ncbi:MAG: hypothetical protein WKG07_48555 [Hymenobacter sp.]